MTLFSFLIGFGFQEILVLFITFVLPIGIFILLRPLVIWYFKVDVKINLLKEQNALLKDIFDSQGGHK
jgi:hypothetical protein